MENEEKENASETNKEDNFQNNYAIDKDIEDRASEAMGLAAEKYDDFAKQETDSENLSLNDEMIDGNQFEEKKDFKSILEKNKKRVLVFTGFLIVLICVVAAFSFLMQDTGIKNEKTSAEKGNMIIKSSLEAMKGVNSYTYDGTMSFNYKAEDDTISGGKYGMDYQIAYKGVVDNNEQAPATYSSISYNKATILGEQQENASAGIELAAVNGKNYMKLNDFNAENYADFSAEDYKEAKKNALNQIKGNWYYVSEENYNLFYEELFGTSAISGLNNIKQDGIQNFSDVFNNYNVIGFSKDLGMEQVEGVDSFHYEVALDTEEALQFAAALMEKSGNAASEGELKNMLDAIKNGSEEVENFKEVMDYVMNNVDFEIWIGKDDKLIRRFKVSGTFDESFFKGLSEKIEAVYGESLAAEEIDKLAINFDFDFILSGFNSSKVEEPKEAKDLAEIMAKLQQASSSPILDSPSAPDSDEDGLSDEQEKFYGSDPAKADTDGDGYLDGNEVQNGYDPLVAGSARLDYSKLNAIK